MPTEITLERLRESLTEEYLLHTAARLEAALRRRSGHIVVLGQEPEEASVFVDFVLKRAADCSIVETSALRAELPEVSSPLGGPKVVAVIHDAEFAGSARLEELRFWAESMPAGAGKLRLLLVGSSRLERALAHPVARLLSSRVHTRIQLRKRYLQGYTAPGARKAGRAWSLSACMVLAFAAVACMRLANAPQHRAQPMIGALREAFANATTWALQSPAKLMFKRPGAAFASVRTPPTGENKRHSVARGTVYTKTAAPASLENLPRSATRIFVDGKEIETGGAVLETLLMVEQLATQPDHEVFVGAFADANGAYALRTMLLHMYPQAAVAPFETATGTRYGIDLSGDCAEASEQRRPTTSQS